MCYYLGPGSSLFVKEYGHGSMEEISKEGDSEKAEVKPSNIVEVMWGCDQPAMQCKVFNNCGEYVNIKTDTSSR